MIRPTRPGDEQSILALVRAAFSDPIRDGSDECRIVRRTWAATRQDERLELVAEGDGEIVGHVLAAPGRLDGRSVLVAGVAPVCVEPTRQGSGVGTSLMERLFAEAEVRDWALLLLLGDAAFYGRFGFERAGPLGITYEPAGPDSPHFLAKRLRHYDTGLRGCFSYTWE